MKNRAIILRTAVVVATAMLCACSGSTSSPTAGAQGAGGLTTLSDGRQNNVTTSAAPASLSLAPSATGTFVVTVKSGHELTAVSADLTCATVAPASQKPVNNRNGNSGGDGDTKSGTFTVTAGSPGAGCSTTVTVTGNDQETVVVPVSVAASVIRGA